jgi:hypothetical protein
MGGVAVPLPSGLPAGVKNVTYNASFWTDTPNVTVNWKWAASAYSNLGTDNNALTVKPVDNNNLSAYKNGDQSGTPEAFKSSVVAGGTGNGGNNFTGNTTPSTQVKPMVGDGVQDYPYASSNPLTSVAFNESTVLKAANLDTTNGYFQLWYSDEHALALGVRQVNVVTSAGTKTTNYSIATMNGNPDVAINPAIGATATTGDQAGTDVSGRPMTPMLYVTDTTNNPNNRSGDWQWGGTGVAPNAVFGTWKSFTRTVTYTNGTPTVSVTADADPVKNNWNLGAGADAAPAGLASEGYGAEVRWNLSSLNLQAGHTYRFYVMVHDGDQNKVGGDAGQASFNYTIPGPVNPPPSNPPPAPAGTVSGYVYAAVTDDGIRQPATEAGIQYVVVTLIGTDNLGNAVNVPTTTDQNGQFSFTGLRGGNYYLVAAEPSGSIPGKNSVGTINGVTTGNLSPNANEIDGLTLPDMGTGLEYDFAVLPGAPNS